MSDLISAGKLAGLSLMNSTPKAKPGFFLSFAMAGIFLAAAAGVHAETTLTQGLVAFYQFNGNALDSSGSQNNGAAIDVTSVSDRFGVANHAFHFNGTDSEVSFPDTVF